MILGFSFSRFKFLTNLTSKGEYFYYVTFDRGELRFCNIISPEVRLSEQKVYGPGKLQN